MIEVEDVKNINLENLNTKIENQLKKRDTNNKVIFVCNKMSIAQIIIIVIELIVFHLIKINNENLINYMFNTGDFTIILPSLIPELGIAYFEIIKKVFKNKNKILIDELNKNLSIQKELEFDKKNSIEITDIEIKEEDLKTIKEIELPEIIKTNSSHNNKTKIRTLKKDKNNVKQ